MSFSDSDGNWAEGKNRLRMPLRVSGVAGDADMVERGLPRYLSLGVDARAFGRGRGIEMVASRQSEEGNLVARAAFCIDSKDFV